MSSITETERPRCKHEGCNRPGVNKRKPSYCPVHRNRNRAGKDMDAPIRRNMKNRGKVCRHGPCKKPAEQMGFCKTHANRDYRCLDMDLPFNLRKILCKHGPCNLFAANIKKGGEYCALHQRRIDNNLPLDATFEKVKCQGASDCERDVKDVMKGGIYCAVHLRRHRLGLPMDDPIIAGLNGTIYLLKGKDIGIRRVGLTATTIKERLRRYIDQAHAEKDNDLQLYKVIREHVPKDAEITGTGNGAYEVAGVLTIAPIMVGIDNYDALNACEDAFIQILNTMHPNGHNYKAGGGHMPSYKYPRVCGVDGCEEKTRRHGYCENHGRRFILYGDPLYEPKRKPRVKKQCDVDGCNITCADYRQYCQTHHRIWKEHGDPLYRKPVMNQTPCNVPGCNELATSRWMCAAHYQEWYQHGEVDPAREHKPKAKCKEDGCERPVQAHDWCKHHYQQWYLSNKPPPSRADAIAA